MPHSGALPAYEEKQKVYALLNGTFHAAIVLEVAEDATASGGNSFLYYIRYVEQDSRLDQWLPACDIKERHQGRAAHGTGGNYQHTNAAGGGVKTRRQISASEQQQQQQQQQQYYALHGFGGDGVTSGGSLGGPAAAVATTVISINGAPPQSPPPSALLRPSSSLSPTPPPASVSGVPTADASSSNAKGGGSSPHHLVKVSKMRARRDSAFFSRTKNIYSICMGPYEVETWYFSPYHLARPEVQQRLQAAAQCVTGSTELQLIQSTGPSTSSTASPTLPTTSAGVGGSSGSASAGVNDGSGRSTAAGSGNSGSTVDVGVHRLSSSSSPRSTATSPSGRQYAIATRSFSLHICPFCLRPFLDNGAVIRHLQQDCLRHPPGNEIYRDPVRRLVVLELDGSLEPTFCEHLALLSKLFLEHKALDHDMTPFLFYVLCSVETHGMQVLGYFSKEKQTPEPYNLSCILVLPQYQSRGIGRFLIELSYELSRREGKVGTPEKPLSDLGEKLYLGFWCDCVTMALARAMEEGHCVSVDYLVQATSMMPADVLRALQHQKLLSGHQLTISDDIVERCYAKRLKKERDIASYTFHTHLLSWAPGLYEEFRGVPPPPTFAPWKDPNARLPE